MTDDLKTIRDALVDMRFAYWNKDADCPHDFETYALEKTEKAISCIDRLEQRMTWQPIETAPKDGTRILLAGPEGPFKQPVVGRWDEDKYAAKPKPYWNNDRAGIFGIREIRTNQPTHWMPIHQMPKDVK